MKSCCCWQCSSENLHTQLMEARTSELPEKSGRKHSTVDGSDLEVLQHNEDSSFQRGETLLAALLPFTWRKPQRCQRITRKCVQSHTPTSQPAVCVFGHRRELYHRTTSRGIESKQVTLGLVFIVASLC